MSSIRAVLFDFDGVLANTEPVHLQMFRAVLQRHAISLTEADYLEKYLGLDDRACFDAVFRDWKKELTPQTREELVREKNQKFLEFVGGRRLLLPGVSDVIRGLDRRYYLSIVSGALRNEIEQVVRSEGLRDFFQVIIGADQVSKGKPDPQGFLMALKLLNRDHIPESEILLPGECLAVEDSPWGIEAARKAGIFCVAVTTSYPALKLTGADHVIADLSGLTECLKKVWSKNPLTSSKG